MLSLLGWFRRARPLFIAVALCAGGLIAAAVAVQIVDHIEPCPLCILQRYAFTFVALFAALAAAFGGFLRIGFALLGIASALGGAGIAAWHVHLQLFSPAETSCGPTLQYLLNNLPIGRALPRIFLGYGDCSEVNWTFLHLSLPAWSLLWLLTLSALLVLALRRR
jgi:protein dithiol:quinone oxidoreductase